jgi:hypothetical protein
VPNVANCLNDRAGIERTSTLYRRNLNPGWQIILTNPLLSVRSRHDKHRNLARLKNPLLKVDRPSGADNDIQRWIWLLQEGTKLFVRIGERWIDIFGCPKVLG